MERCECILKWPPINFRLSISLQVTVCITIHVCQVRPVRLSRFCTTPLPYRGSSSEQCCIKKMVITSFSMAIVSNS